ncbi:MAG: FG-GAP repeat protein, partial [Thermoplasmata archaeon]|nr:FG-GAP repeat protein [Thermoplasmata archaeon]
WTEMLTVTKTTDDDSYQTFSDDTLSAYTGTVYVGMANTNLSSGSITVDAVYIDDMYFSCIPYDELLGEQSFASTDYITASDSAVTGTVSGTHASTQSTDDTYESITEVASSATYDSDYTASETFTESDSNTLTHTATQAQDGTTEDIVELSVGGSSSTTEIRYMRSDSATVNGLTADSLSTTQSTTAQTTTLTSTTIIYAGIRVWKRDSGGTETEITSGTAVAIASATSTAIVSGTWSCPQTALAATDSIVVRWYADGATPPTNLIQDFTTEQLGATQLDANTWTVYYYLSERQNGDSVSWGTSTANTRVEDFKWSASVSPYYSLEHEWQFDATPVSASQYEFQAHVGWDSAGAGDDTFTYYYSTTGSDPVGTGDWVEMFTDTTQALNTLTFDLDADGYTGGAFYVGVIDTASSGDGQDTLEVDYLRVYTTVTPASNSLEHKWTISVPSSGTDSTFYVEAYRTDLDSENFELYYSTTGSGSVSTWTSMFDITKTTDDDSYQQHSDATLDAFDGTLYIGVIDASTVDSSLDTVYVDHMYLRVGGALIPSNFGSIVSSAGDINDDGKDDILVGAPEASNGEVYLYYGGASASSGSITNTTQSDFTESGSSLASSNPNNNIYATSTGELNLTGTGGWSSTSMYANYETGGDVGAYIYDAQWIAQPFDVDAGDTFRLTNVSLYVNDMGASDSMTIEIRIDDAGSPGLGAGNLLGTQTIDGDNVDSWQDFTFGSPLALTGGSKYWICVSNTNAVDTDSYTWELMDGGTYSAGTICLSSDQGTSWGSQLAYAAYFRAYGQLDTAIYSTPGYYTSSESSTSASITGIKPYWNLTTPAGTTAWIDISRDGGTTWNQSGLTNGAWYSFPTEASGDQLCYQVTMKATDNTVTPVLQDLTIYYNLSTIAASITGASSGDKFGFSVTGAGDIDGDGIDDILIGAPGNDTADGSKANGGGVFAFCGGAYLSGDVSASSANFTYYGETAGDMLGYSVGPIGDVNSYGDDDIVVGAPYYDSSAGKAYVLSVALPMTNAVTFTVEEHGLNPESKVNLSWSGMNGALKYNVYRSENPWGFDFDTPTATINAPTTSWTDESASRNTTNAHNATTYYYAIKAENYLAEKGPFTITAIHRLDLVPGWNLVTWLSNETKDIETGAFANLEADDGTNPTTYIYDKVERWHPDTQVWESYTTDGDLGNFSDMEAGYAYAIQCRVSAIWSFGEDCGAPVFSTADDAVLNAPGSFTLARNDTNADYVDLDWDTVASADHYNIYRSYCKWGFDFNAPIHTTTDTWWNDTTATQENGAYNTSVYYYIVRAVDASGNIEKNLNVVGMHRMDLMTGIDYISWTIHKTETTANALDSLTQFTDYISVARWNESGQAFDTSVSSFERGYGYGIYTLQACTWTYIEYAA